MFEIKNWMLGWSDKKAANPDTVSGIKKHCEKIINAKVPGAFETALFEAGEGPDPYFGCNAWEYRKYEASYIYWFSEFISDTDGEGKELVFEGIDTVADIYLNGTLIYHADNMFIPHICSAALVRKGKNEITVAFTPLLEEAKKYKLPAMSNTLFYNYEALYIRSPMHTFGWDIAPRFLGQGIFKPVYIREKKKDFIDELFVYTLCVKPENNYARVRVYFSLDITGINPREYTFKITGKCGDSVFSGECCPSAYQYTRLAFTVNDAKLWWPKNQGEQNLYDITAELWHGDTLVDVKKQKLGIRTVELSSTEVAGENGKNADFSLIVNGRRIFIMGTNWVPLSPFHSCDTEKLGKALELLDDIGCNAVRMWGGNIYESDEFFDFCDRHGILVWQDFAMACAVYPRSPDFLEKLEPEITYTVKRLRNHPSLAIWSGDNECDLTCRDWMGIRRDPNRNTITREFIPSLLEEHDFTRPYIPSSPYISDKCFKSGLPPVEDHLWGPRDYFKSDFYIKSKCCFASEIGYHGCPSVESLKKFISPEMLFPCLDDKGEPNPEWLAHSTESQPDGELSYKYRIRLFCEQIKTLFGAIPDNISDFVEESQISQAEAFKYFIESFRIKRPERTGIIWWNLLDCWPQISDAVVDSYFDKKRAYDYIARSQEPLCLMLDEPSGNMFTLWAVNDKCTDDTAEYSVTDVTDGKTLLCGKTDIAANEVKMCGMFDCDRSEHRMLLIEWKSHGKTYKNHYYTDILNISYENYLRDFEKCGFSK